MAAKNREYFEEILELLEPFGDVTGKAMFGGYGFWERGDMFALIDSSGALHFKADDLTELRYRKAKCTQFAPEMSAGQTIKMRYWTVPKAVLRDDQRLQEWAEEAIGVGHATSKKKKKGTAKQAPARPAAAKKAAR